jgi:hypothetical protein
MELITTEKTMSIDTININEVEYVRKDSLTQQAPSLNGLKHVIVRTYSAGVFAGYIESQNGQEVVLLKARRLWQWAGAASLSQLATDGTSNPTSCKFPCEVETIKLFNAIEILDTTDKAKKSIDSVTVWKV